MHDSSRRERQILEIIYRRGEATANEIVQDLPERLANATVRTLLRNMEDKGTVKHRKEGKRFVYSPCVPRKSAAAKALQKVVDVFFGGSVEDAVIAHLSDPRTKLSPEQARRLRRLIAEKREES
ncbi:MAG: BlaI/MecI/CopY family transcriptional regulator [bacterium]|nr:BlaI/MecI/CopY family transcriptional regulator [bacterium]